MKNYDVAIIGSGLVGMTLALALPELSLTTVLIEAKPERHYKPGQGKALALNYASISLLKKLSVWQDLDALATPIEAVHISEKGRFGVTKLTASEVDLPALGYLIPESDLSASVARALKNKVTWLHDARLTSIGVNNRLLLTRGDVQDEITCDLLVACDGIDSKVRELLGIQVEEKDYQHSALVARVQLSRSHNNVAYERFTDGGTIAMLPLKNNQCAMVLTAENKLIEEWQALSDDAFLQRLQSSFGYRLGRLQVDAARFCFPLAMMQAKEQVRPGVAILGHAAHVIHPVAAQGLNLSLRDVMTFVDLLKGVLAEKGDISDDQWLKTYAKTRAKDQKYTIRFTRALVDVFSSDAALVKRWRKLGLLGVELASPLKKMLTKLGSGVKI